MEVKNVSGSIRYKDKSENKIIKEILLQIIYFVLGIIVSQGTILGNFSPFGISLVSAVLYKYMLMSAFGTIFGYVVLGPIDSFRYMATVIAVCAIRWLLKDIVRINRSRLFAPIIAFLPIASTGFALINVSSSQNSALSMCFVEGIFAGAVAFFLKEGIIIFSSNRTLTSLTGQESACLVVSSCVILLAVGSIEFEGISVGRIFAVVIVLLCAKYGSVSGGSISGVATGVLFGLSSSKFAFICGCYGLGGLISGIFAPFGKISTTLSFFTCSFIMAFSADKVDMAYKIIVESFVGGIIFMFLPKSIGNFVSAVFLPEVDDGKAQAFKKAIVSRMNTASVALGDVTDCVSGVSQRLSEIYRPEIEWVYNRTAQKICKTCGIRSFCWRNSKQTTLEDMHKLDNILKDRGRVTEEDVSNAFSKRCCKLKEIAESITESYREFLSCQEAEQRVTQVRSVVAGQFSGLSQILKDLSTEFDEYISYDTDSSLRICQELKNIGLSVVSCSCPIKRKNIMNVEIEVIANKDCKVMQSDVLRLVCQSCGRIFEKPCITYIGDRIRLVFTQKARFAVDVGTCQHTSSNAELCGDSIEYFNDGLGHFVAVLSDGMGTGGRAAVDSNMTTSIMSKLCRAGLGYDCALQIVNSALLIKSEDESLATLDLLSIDLFTGKAKIMKAGSVLTYFKRNSKVYRKDMSSLPIGILNGVNFASEDVLLEVGDIVVMISDGAVFNDDKWLENLIKDWSTSGTQDLAQAVVEEAFKRRSNTHDDDISAIAMRITES